MPATSAAANGGYGATAHAKTSNGGDDDAASAKIGKPPVGGQRQVHSRKRGRPPSHASGSQERPGTRRDVACVVAMVMETLNLNHKFAQSFLQA